MEDVGTQVEFGVKSEHSWSLRGGRRWNTGEFGVESEHRWRLDCWKAVEHRWSMEWSWNTGGVWSGIGTQVEFGEVEGGGTQVEFGVELEHRWSLRGGRRWNTGKV